jgi:hypothetical protein
MTQTVELAKACIASGTDIEVFKLYRFTGGLEAHDDRVQEQLERDFQHAFSQAHSELEAAFGCATTLDLDDDDDAHLVPLCGVFAAASWSIGKTRLYLAAAHEDRETPFILAMGVI